MPTEAEWLARACSAIVHLLESEHACVWPEIEAKLADRPWGALPYAVNPHHLTTARRKLLRAGDIEEIAGTTRGGRSLKVLALPNRRGRQRAFEDAAARKRLLYTRYIGWATQYFGRAGEQVAHASLTAAAPLAGYRLIEPRRGQVTHLFGQPIPVGPLDNGATLQIVEASGRPIGHATVPVEVKNIHHWIYAESPELFELLDKAAQLQLRHPDLKFVPVLVCRRGHPTAFRMAKDLGFFIADARAQFLPPLADIEPKQVTELRNGLGLVDLIITEGPDDRLTRLLAEGLPSIALSAAERFEQAAPILADFAPRLRSHRARSTLMKQLRAAAAHLRLSGGW